MTFEHAATAACVESNTRLMAIPLPSDADGIRAVVRRRDQLERELIDRLEELEPPADQREVFERAVALRRRTLEAEGPEVTEVVRGLTDAFGRLGLHDCAGSGLTGVPRGREFVRRIQPFCVIGERRVRRAVDRVERDPGPAALRRVAAVFRRLARHRVPGVPAPAARLYAQARELLHRTAVDLERFAAATARDDEAAGRRAALAQNRDGIAASAAWVLLGLGTCEDMYSQLERL